MQWSDQYFMYKKEGVSPPSLDGDVFDIFDGAKAW